LISNIKILLFFILMATFTKQELVDSIQELKKINNEIDILNKEIKSRKLRKKEVSDVLVNVMKTNEIDSFDTSDGNIIYTKSKIKQSISKKYLIETLDSYFENIPQIDSNNVVDYILDKRKVKIKEDIKHKKNKD
tara:strand:- start:1322 stop:1726 length:405 start_codon:yes stop_codon:yes gene_type:complete